jgi:hypothetical protein
MSEQSLTSRVQRGRAWVRERRRADGKVSHQVLYRRGGRAFAIESGGTFRTSRDAETRRVIVEGWLAAGLDPREQLKVAVDAERTRRRRFDTVATQYLASRLDAAGASQRAFGYAVQFWNRDLATRDPAEITTDEIQRIVAESNASPRTLKSYMATLRQIFDHAK